MMGEDWHVVNWSKFCKNCRISSAFWNVFAKVKQFLEHVWLQFFKKIMWSFEFLEFQRVYGNYTDIFLVKFQNQILTQIFEFFFCVNSVFDLLDLCKFCFVWKLSLDFFRALQAFLFGQNYWKFDVCFGVFVFCWISGISFCLLNLNVCFPKSEKQFLKVFQILESFWIFGPCGLGASHVLVGASLILTEEILQAKIY